MDSGRHRCIALLVLLSLAWVESVCAHTPSRLPLAPDQIRETRPVPPIDRDTILFESFEGNWPPTNWTILHEGVTTTWEQDSQWPHSGEYCARVTFGPEDSLQDEFLVSESIDLTGYTSAQLSFYEAQFFWSGFGEHHYVGVSTTSQTDPGAFTWLVDWTPENHEMLPSIGGGPDYGEDPVVIDLSAYLDEPVVYLCFRYFGTHADSWFVDDVRVFQPLAHDIAVEDLNLDGLHIDAPSAVAPEVVVENLGGNPETFDLRVTATESGSLTYDQTLSVTLSIASVDTVAFPPLTLNPGNYYHLTATALLPSDEDTANDDAESSLDTYTETHVPLGYLHTNAGSSTCAAADILLDAYLDSQPDEIAIIRVHGQHPWDFDPMYLDNLLQTEELVQAHGGYDSMPQFWADGLDIGGVWTDFTPSIEARKQFRSPGIFTMRWAPDAEQLTVRLDLLNPLDPIGEYRVFVSVVEDSIELLGPNGYPVHSQVFKHMYPDTDGIQVSPDPGASTLAIDCPLHIGEVYEEWGLENLSAVVYLQEMGSRRVWQAQSRLLSSLIGDLAIDLTGASVARWDTVTVALTVDPLSLPVMGIEAEIEFEENKLRLLSIDAGNWYTESGQEHFFFDYTPSPPEVATTAHFASSFLSGTSSETGEVALLTFVALEEGRHTLSFLMSKARDAANTELTFTASVVDSIRVTAAGNLRIDPSVSNVETIDRFSVALRVEPIARAVMGVEADIEFDESVVRLDSIVPGAWYRDSGRQFYFFDYTPAPPDSATTIHFASSFLGEPSAEQGEVAVFHFSTLREGETALDFTLAKVRDIENTEMDFESSTGDSIVVRPTGLLTIDPQLSEVEIVDAFSVALEISPTSRQIKGVEVDIDFDESVVRLDSIVAGSWYRESGSEFFFWDYTPTPPDAAESIHFASSFLTGSSNASGAVAVFHFSPLSEGETELRFDLAKVRDPDNTELHFVTSSADSIRVHSTGMLYIDPSVTTVEEFDSFTMDLHIRPRSRAVMGVEADIDFDEARVRLDSITPGPWLTDAGPGNYFLFDYTPELPDSALSIHFASSLLGEASPDSGIVATFHFVAKLAGETPLPWDLVKVRDENNLELSFATSTLDSIIVEPRTTAVSELDPAARGLRLYGNRPNPFNPSTEIHYNLPHAGLWTLDIYDVQGRLQRTLFSELREAGLASITWEGRDDRGRPLGSGVYLTRLSGAGEYRTGKMILLK